MMVMGRSTRGIGGIGRLILLEGLRRGSEQGAAERQLVRICSANERKLGYTRLYVTQTGNESRCVKGSPSSQ